MSNVNLRNITNSFLDVHLVSLKTWRQANEIIPRDKGGPYVVLQEGYDPEALTVTPDEFVLGRSGKWLSLGHFFKMPVPDRRAEFVFGTAGEVMQMMSDLPSKAQVFHPPGKQTAPAADFATDEMANAFRAAKDKEGGKT
jgi:hypothetical protein